MGFLTGKRALIVGVASKLSIASGIAAAMHREGAELAFTYQNDKLRGRVEEFASGWGSRPELCFPCDVADDSQIEAVFAALGKHWDGLDIIVHSVGFAPGDQLDGDFTAVTTREGFRIAHNISAYSFIALAKAGREMMKGRNGSLLTLSYLGAERTMPNYNGEPLRAHGLVPRGYFLCVGTLEPRKNLSLALRAHGQLPAAVRQRFPLMIVACRDGKVARLTTNCARRWLRGRCGCSATCRTSGSPS